MQKIILIFRFLWFLIKRFALKVSELKRFLPKWNYKKIFIILFVVIFLFAGFSAFFDSVRIKNQKPPVFAFESVSKEPLKVTYTGLGYKIIRFPRRSQYEPFENNLAVKMGTWFMKFELENVPVDTGLFDIIDLTKMEDIYCDDSIETFYEDQDYLYQFPCIKSMYVLAHFKDGAEMTVSEALNQGKITIEDLDEWNIDYIKTKK